MYEGELNFYDTEKMWKRAHFKLLLVIGNKQ